MGECVLLRKSFSFLSEVLGGRFLVRLAVDALAWVIALFVWMMLRFEGLSGLRAPGALTRVAISLALVISVSSVIGLFLKRRNGWPITGSFEDVWRLAGRNLAAGIVLVIVNQLASPQLLPISVCFGATAGATLIALGLSATLRATRDFRLSKSYSTERAIIFGAGNGARQIIDAIAGDSSSRITGVALLDDDITKRDLTIRRLRVVGDRHSMKEVASSFDASLIIIAIPSANAETVRKLSALAVEAGLGVRILPSIAELLRREVTVEDVRALSTEDLLGRPVVAMDSVMYEHFISGRRVLITGAGGSIGSEISRQVFALGPQSLTLVDRDESALHALQLKLEGRALLDSRHIVVADIRDRERMHHVFVEHRPEVVFHAAALKHLPLLEMWPSEAVKSNVFGTMNVLDAAGAVGTPVFVNISTDKAANPISALGSSKRLAEGLTSSAVGTSAGKFLSVRFGNVLGSRGTALDAFQAQIARGGPLTVTDPDVTRYFMTVSEAVHLVLTSAVVGESGDVMVLDMGEPVRIADIAMQLAGQAPGPIEIVYTGLRPGEKLHEDLFNDGEKQVRSSHPRIFRVSAPPLDGQVVQQLDGVSDADATAAMLAIVAEHMSPSRRSGASVGQVTL